MAQPGGPCAGGLLSSAAVGAFLLMKVMSIAGQAKSTLWYGAS